MSSFKFGKSNKPIIDKSEVESLFRDARAEDDMAKSVDQLTEHYAKAKSKALSLNGIAIDNSSEWGALDLDADRLSLKDVNLEGELVKQLKVAKKLQYDTMSDPEIPTSNKAQVASMVAATIEKLVKLQVDVQKDEELKLIERVLIETLIDFDEEVRESFFARYREAFEVAKETKTGAK